MRVAALISASVLVAGCSHAVEGNMNRAEPALSATPSPTRSTSPTPSVAPAHPPAAGAPIDQVIRWIEAGTLVDASAFHAATRDSVATPLGDDVAFTTPSGKTQGMTDAGAGGTLDVGSAHGDPGRFVKGTGPQLPYGQSLNFGDYRCRSDQSGLFCVNYAHQSAAGFSDAGIEPFGCLQRVDAPADIGEKFSC
jgi:hypothetical protein